MEFIHVGHSAKSRGINGNFKARIEQRFIPDILRARAVFININGSKVPYLIETVEDQGTVILKLDEIDTPEEVSTLLSKELFLEISEVSTEAQFKVEAQNVLVGYQLIDQDGDTIGIIEDILEYPDQLLAKLIYNSKEILLPIHEDLVINMDEVKRELVLTIADGLLDL